MKLSISNKIVCATGCRPTPLTATASGNLAPPQTLSRHTVKEVISPVTPGISSSLRGDPAQNKGGAAALEFLSGAAAPLAFSLQSKQEGFEPINVGNRLVIHDGRHLPESPADISIEIDARLAFGTGTHETTRMICSALLDKKMDGLRVLDCGTGTGILSICALKLGASEAVGYDIDEWSADNARHNAVINSVDNRFTALLGDASILNKVEGTFQLVLANINRNILLADMPSFRQKMAPGASLILSGFYTDDTPLLLEKAQTLGLKLEKQLEDQNWACLVLTLA